jgi:hypothetical protein
MALYPLILDTTIPANAKGNKFVVDFDLNRAVNLSDMNKLFGSIKTINSGSIVNNALRAVSFDKNRAIFPPINYTEISSLNYDPNKKYYIWDSNSEEFVDGNAENICLKYLEHQLDNGDIEEYLNYGGKKWFL